MRIIIKLFYFFILFSFLISWKSPENETKDTTKVIELNELSWECSSYDFYNSINLANEAISISKKLGYSKGIATGNNRIGLAYDYKGDYEIALKHYSKALEIFKELNDSSSIATTYNNIGTSFYCQAKYVEAHEYYIQSLSIREKIEDLKGAAQSYNNIGLIFRVQKKYKKAIESYQKSIKTRKQINDQKGIMYAEQNIGVAFEKVYEFDSALYHYSRAIFLAKQLEDSLTFASNLINKSTVNKTLGNYVIAVEQATSAEKILRKINNQHTLAYSLASIGDLYLEMKKYSNSIEYVSESLELSKLLGRRDLEQSCYEILSKTYSQSDNYKQAYEYHKLYTSIKDSIINEKTTNQLNELQTKYETVKKEQQIVSLTQEKLFETQRKSLFLGIAILLFLSMIIIVLLLRQNKLKAKDQAIILKQKLLRSQMNPHFIFNALGSIQSYIFFNKSETAINYLSKFSTLMRDILEGSVHDFIAIEQDVSIVENYLLLQQLRYEEKFNYKIETKGVMENLQIPPMLTQPFIENAIKHGVGEMKSGGEIQVYYNIGQENIIIEIIDNGTGIINSIQADKKHKSYAISLTKERLNLVGKGCNAVLTSPIFENKRGTKVTITIAKPICMNNY